MSTPVRAGEQDLRALAAIVSQDRSDVPDQEGLPPSLLADLMSQIRCDAISVERYDTGRQVQSWLQGSDADDEAGVPEDWAQVFWTHYWDCHVCAYPVRARDLRSVVKTSDFYSMRQWHSTGMYTDCIRSQGIEHHLMLALPEVPEVPELAAEAGRYLRLVLHRGPGPDFSERDRALLVVLRPHLVQAYLDAERRRHPVPRLTPRQNELLRLLAAGHTNSQIARRLGISEGTVRTHLETSTTSWASPAAPRLSPAPSPTAWRRTAAHRQAGRPDCPTAGHSPATAPRARVNPVVVSQVRPLRRGAVLRGRAPDRRVSSGRPDRSA